MKPFRGQNESRPVTSTWYAGIFGDKQLGDNLSTPTVPILQHL